MYYAYTHSIFQLGTNDSYIKPNTGGRFSLHVYTISKRRPPYSE